MFLRWYGNLFHNLEAAAEKARPPTVFRRGVISTRSFPQSSAGLGLGCMAWACPKYIVGQTRAEHDTSKALICILHGISQEASAVFSRLAWCDHISASVLKHEPPSFELFLVSGIMNQECCITVNCNSPSVMWWMHEWVSRLRRMLWMDAHLQCYGEVPQTFDIYVVCDLSCPLTHPCKHQGFWH